MISIVLGAFFCFQAVAGNLSAQPCSISSAWMIQPFPFWGVAASQVVLPGKWETGCLHHGTPSHLCFYFHSPERLFFRRFPSFSDQKVFLENSALTPGDLDFRNKPCRVLGCCDFCLEAMSTGLPTFLKGQNTGRKDDKISRHASMLSDLQVAGLHIAWISPSCLCFAGPRFGRHIHTYLNLWVMCFSPSLDLETCLLSNTFLPWPQAPEIIIPHSEFYRTPFLSLLILFNLLSVNSEITNWQSVC